MKLLELTEEKALILLNILENEIWELQTIRAIDHEVEEDIRHHIRLLEEIKEKLE